MSESDREAPAASQAVVRKASPFSQPVAIAFGVATALVVLLWFATQGELNRMRDDVARRLQLAELEIREARIAGREAQEGMRDVQVRLGTLEGKVSDSHNHQVALEQLYQELSRGRDEWIVAEIEQTIALASQQLQLAGNVQGALVALQTADARLARSDRPQFIPLRKVINRDIDRLKALPAVDLPGLTLKLDEVTNSIDKLALLIDGRPQLASEEQQADEGFWSRLTGVVWGELKQLIRVQRLEDADQGLMSPEQSYFLRENLKLRLMHARLALMQRNDAVFRADLKVSAQWVNRYFDTRQKRVSATLATVEQLAAATLNIDLPTLADSLGAIRSFKVTADKPR
jgi:uroporphyrin-III C-methyltransferase